MIQAARRLERQLVGALQSRPAVGAPDEFLRQPESQLRMRLQIGQTRDALRARVVGAHGQRVGIVEAQRHRDRQPHGCKLGVELGERWDGVELENFAGDRARVFGVDVDAAGRKRVQDDGGVAEPWLVYGGRLAGALRGLLDDLAENVGLGETLRADVERRLRSERRRVEEAGESGGRGYELGRHGRAFDPCGAEPLGVQPYSIHPCCVRRTLSVSIGARAAYDALLQETGYAYHS